MHIKYALGGYREHFKKHPLKETPAMTEPAKPPYMPTMDEALRFIQSNPDTATSMIVEVRRVASEDDATSNGRLYELWRQGGGSINREGKAWIERETLPGLLRFIIAHMPKQQS